MKSPLRRKVEDVVIWIFAITVVVVFFVLRYGAVSSLRETSRGTALEPLLELIAPDVR